VLVVVTDLWNTSGKCPAALPEAEIVADKFHVMRMPCEAVEFIRKHIRKQQLAGKVNERDPAETQGPALPAVARQSELNPHELALLKDIRNSTRCSPIAQQTKEGSSRCTTHRIARRPGDVRGVEGVDGPAEWGLFRRLAVDVDNWHRHVFTVFDLPYTNAYTSRSTASSRT